MSAADTVNEALRGCLPPGAPTSFASITSVETFGKGRNQSIVANLVMFDGLKAQVELSKWSMGWSHRYTYMEGGPCSFDGEKWCREDVDLFGELAA